MVGYVSCIDVYLNVFYKYREIILLDIRRYRVSVGDGTHKTHRHVPCECNSLFVRCVHVSARRRKKIPINAHKYEL